MVIQNEVYNSQAAPQRRYGVTVSGLEATLILLVQAALSGLVFLLAYLVVFVWHGPLFMAAIFGCALLIALWFIYLIWQAKHPDWWPPWDEGLPQTMRMANAFVPVFGIFILGLILIPVFQKVRERSIKQHHKVVAPVGRSKTGTT